MQTGANPPTLLEAQDILLTWDFRHAPRRETPIRPTGGGHDFLVLSLRPDLTPDLFPGAEGRGVPHNCERNMPQK